MTCTGVYKQRVVFNTTLKHYFIFINSTRHDCTCSITIMRCTSKEKLFLLAGLFAFVVLVMTISSWVFRKENEAILGRISRHEGKHSC